MIDVGYAISITGIAIAISTFIAAIENPNGINAQSMTIMLSLIIVICCTAIAIDAWYINKLERKTNQ